MGCRGPRRTKPRRRGRPPLDRRAAKPPRVDGNKRLALAATIACYGLNGFRLTLSNDEAYELLMAVAAGHLDDVEGIAGRLGSKTAPRR